MTTIRQLCAALGLMLLANLAQAATGPLLSQLQLRATPVEQVDAALLPASAATSPSTALDYARSAPVSLNSQQHGRWHMSADAPIWRLLIESDGAVNLSLTLAELQLPAGAQLRLYDGDGYLWHGPYSSAQLTRHEQFWTPIIPGQQILLELSVPSDRLADTRLGVSQVHHGDRSLQTGAKSGSCNVDVACPSADAWTDEARAAARITIGGRRLCSAVLLNNTRENGEPLLLTAKHCGIGEDEQMPASSVVVYWNYETSQCSGNPDGSLRQNQSGSVLLADHAESDFSLVRLDEAPPAHYQVYYAGWDATGIPPSNGVSIHHPSGDEKRISFFDDGASARQARVDGEPVESWQLQWSRGITEAGSSGGALWNGSRYVIGQLSGGNSSCDNPDGIDVFGRLDVSWDAGSQPDAQLKAWLDPDNTGSLRLPGRDSSDTTLNANPDVIRGLPADSGPVLLDVLANDGGQQPLRITSVAAEGGEAMVVDGRIRYRFAAGDDRDTLQYTVVNRWGETATVAVAVERQLAVPAGRGGVLPPALLILLLIARCRWKRR